MRVEVVSIGTKLLMSDILDTYTAYITHSLRELHVHLTCKVTVGNDMPMITDVLRVALSRADIVIAIGGQENGNGSITHQAIAEATEQEVLARSPGISGAVELGGPKARSPGLLIEAENGTLIYLPGNRREMAYLLETEALPYIQRRLSTKIGRVLLRTVDIMESSLKQQLSDLVISSNHRITYDSFAGQTSIQLWVEAETEKEVSDELEKLKEKVITQLGDHIYGEGEERLEDVVLHSLKKSRQSLAIVECETDKTLIRMLTNTSYFHEMIITLPISTISELADYLALENPTPDEDLNDWCRTAAAGLRSNIDADLHLLIIKQIAQGGVQIFVSLASSHGVSVTRRSFGGHPENINQWVYSLGLAHLRRWLLAN